MVLESKMSTQVTRPEDEHRTYSKPGSTSSILNLFTVWTLCLITAAFSQDMETTPSVTTLYPTNKTVTRNLTINKSLKAPPSQTWKVEAVLSKSKFTETEVNISDVKEGKGMDEGIKEDISEFKPSVHLGSFFDEDDAEVIDKPIVTPVYKKPPKGFVSSINDEYQPAFNQIQKEYRQKNQKLPYKFEDAHFSNGELECCEDSIESRPTVEAPAKIPAGGLYKTPGAFKEKPTSDEKFDLDIIDDNKGVVVRKRLNPWKSVLRLVTAFIPAGLIISALTPSVITIHNIDNKRNQAGVARRSDSIMSNLSPISEQCRRRLLCEIHSERYYMSTTSKSHISKKNCHKLHCEDTEALWKMLRWLFTYNRPEDDHDNKYNYLNFN